jgi:hypothetical protein
MPAGETGRNDKYLIGNIKNTEREKNTEKRK